MLTARDIMTTDVLTFDPDVSVREAVRCQSICGTRKS